MSLEPCIHIFCILKVNICLHFISVAPGAPRDPQTKNVFKDHLTLTWSAPEKDGGSTILGYHIERRSTTSKRWVFINKSLVKETSYICKELFEGQEYEFRIAAENKVGTGQPSQPSAPVLAKDPWGNCRLVNIFLS